MVSRQEVEQIVLRAIDGLNRARPSSQQLELSPTAPIFGRGSPLDSLGLVALLIDVEDLLRDIDVEVTLSDERALSQSRSPFRSVPALVEYITSVAAPVEE